MKLHEIRSLQEEHPAEMLDFTADEIRDLERKMGEDIGEAVEITAIDKGHEGDGSFRAHIMHDGVEGNKTHGGSITFKCRQLDNKVEDYEMTNITGRGYFKHPFQNE